MGLMIILVYFTYDLFLLYSFDSGGVQLRRPTLWGFVYDVQP